MQRLSRVCFQHYKDWVVHFIAADCRTTIGRRDRFLHFATEEDYRAFVSRCDLDDIADFEHSMRAWSRGTSPTSSTNSTGS